MQLLSLPATRCRRKYVARFRVPTFLPLRGLVEEFQSLLYRALLPIEINFSAGITRIAFPAAIHCNSSPGLIPYWSAMALGTVNCSSLVTRHILTLARNPIPTKQPAGVPCAANRSSQGPTGAEGNLS